MHKKIALSIMHWMYIEDRCEAATFRPDQIIKPGLPQAVAGATR